jgi:hypothetical protein
MRDASVGFQCPDCVKEASRGSRQNRALYGGERSADPRLTSYVLIGINALVWLAIAATGGGKSRLLDQLALRANGLCSPGDGYLYDIEVQLVDPAGTVVDSYHQAVGVRTVAVSGNRFLINGDPFHFTGFGMHEDHAVIASHTTALMPIRTNVVSRGSALRSPPYMARFWRDPLLASLTQSGHWKPTAASRMQSGQMGLSQRWQRIQVSRSGCR